MTTTVAPFDVYGKTDQLDTPILETMVTRLEARGEQARFQQMMGDYLEAMQIDQAQSVLDLGCGTGVAARTIAARPNFTGKITAVVLSDHLVASARQLAAREGVADQIDFRVGDSRSLDLPNDSFDAVVAHTLVSHVDQLAETLHEIARVVRPGGFVGIFDGDYASLTFSHPDAQQGQRYDELIISAVITQPRAMRRMPHLLAAAGLDLITHFPYVVTDIGRADYWIPALESFRKILPASGAMTAAEAGAWVDARLDESTRNIFFGSS
ncbi:MAG: methyltransferase domain-containing protein, partial [Caldilineaceae bacterium]|nr:methyltransferase domain-containing protein [Caldilineaceae bacterium]